MNRTLLASLKKESGFEQVVKLAEWGELGECNAATAAKMRGVLCLKLDGYCAV